MSSLVDLYLCICELVGYFRAAIVDLQLALACNFVFVLVNFYSGLISQFGLGHSRYMS